MKKLFLLILVLILTVSGVSAAFADNGSASALTPIALTSEAEPPIITAEGAILINADTGEILYEKNSRAVYYPASITKLMTMLLALENGKNDDILTFSHDAVFSIERDSNHIAIDVDEQLSFTDALYAIMLVSANEVANGIAEHIGGTMDNFAVMMTERAKALGAENTSFKNANGLHDDNHYTTAYDMALIARELLSFDLFKKVMATTYYEIEPTNIQPEKRNLYAQHKMINTLSPYYYEYCLGGKTGFTDQALNTLVTYAEKDGMTLICVLLKDTGAAATYTDTTALFNYAFDNYSEVPLFSADGYKTSVNTDNGTLTLNASGDFSATLPKGTNASLIQKVFDSPDLITESVRAGETVGSIKFNYENKQLGEVKLVAAESYLTETTPDTDVKESGLGSIPLIIIAVIIILLIIYLIISVKKEREYRRRKRLRKKRLEAIRATKQS